MAGTFTASDPNVYQYSNELLQIEVPGGVKLEGLDRMRVTLKVELKESPRPPLRHNLDCTMIISWKSLFVK